MALRTHNLPSERFKKPLCVVDVAVFQVVERQYEHIFCTLTIEKSDFDEVA
jgi:hypothetical protein